MLTTTTPAQFLDAYDRLKRGLQDQPLRHAAVGVALCTGANIHVRHETIAPHSRMLFVQELQAALEAAGIWPELLEARLQYYRAGNSWPVDDLLAIALFPHAVDHLERERRAIDELLQILREPVAAAVASVGAGR